MTATIEWRLLFIDTTPMRHFAPLGIKILENTSGSHVSRVAKLHLKLH